MADGLLYTDPYFGYGSVDPSAGDPDETMLGGLNSFYLLVDKPEAYGLPPDPRMPSRNLKPSALWSTLGALALTILGVFHFRERGRHDV